MSKLYISLKAIKSNYALLKKQIGGAECGAVVKANAYGLGVIPVTAALKSAGCKKFFVATFDEAMELREAYTDIEIYIFHGVLKEEVADCIEYDLTPILNNPNQLLNWPNDKPCAIHVDTGMTRLGFEEQDYDLLEGYNITMIMSHLACAESPQNPKSYNQLLEFDKAAKKFPYAYRSMANSYGLFLGKEFHFNLVRPGLALYGGNPLPARENVMQNVVRMVSNIIQITEVKKQTSVGYGATYNANPGQVIATIHAGYADGVMRGLSNRGKCYIGSYECPIVGRVSMDLITIDVTNTPISFQKVGQEVEIFGDKYTITQAAKDAGTIEYEILTRLGQRFDKVYTK